MESAESIASELQNEGLDQPIIPELAEKVVLRAAKCGELLR
jgi:hypothetical protein